MGQLLLDRDSFRVGVFLRDGHKCVVCGKRAVDAHHLIERRLFDNGGYYLDNGVSLCGEHHIEAEMTLITCEELRRLAGIKVTILPQGFDPAITYDKWGNEIDINGNRLAGPLFNTEPVQKILRQANLIDKFMKYVKYPRTPHLPWSEKCSDDDNRLSNVDHFLNKEVVVTIKMDGENTSIYDDKIHARSINSDNHPSRDWIKGLWSQIGYQIPPDWRICGENLYALHTIPYSNLTSYFNVFSIWDKEKCMSWDETCEWCELFGLETVPVIYRGIFNQESITKSFSKEFNGNPTEGYVVRLASTYNYDEFDKSIAKFVCDSFVIKTDKHWMQGKVIPNKLVE